MAKKLFHASIIFFVYFTSVALVWVGFLLYFPVKTLVINNGPEVPVVNKVVHPGDTVYYTVDYCKYINAPAIVSKTLVNSIILPGSPTESNAPSGCYKKELTYQIPPFVLSGDHQIITSVTYKINFLREETVKYATQPFDIEP